MTDAIATIPERRAPLNRNTVVEAARDLLDEGGIDGFSMSRLGAHLGVTAMALYRHIADRADLEQAVTELVLGDLGAEPIADGQWPEAVAGWMHGVRDHWRRHPWLGRFLGNRTDVSQPWLAALDQLARILERAGLPVEDVARELVRISRATAGTVMLENAAPLPHAAGSLRTLPGVDRARWRLLVAHLALYSDDDLFVDVVGDTLVRLRGTLT